MKKIKFSEHVLPHLIAVAVFLIVTVFFFNPVFFDNKIIQQYDIQQNLGTAKSLADHYEKTGEVSLWVNNMFSGMPAYLVTVYWSNEGVTWLKNILSLGLSHPVNNIFIAFVCYYILLLSFRVRPYLAIAGAIAFGLSSYLIIGLSAGHNSRIGAVAFMPLVMAGIHLAYSNRLLLGFGLTTAALALELRENHLQITYYLLLIVGGYGILRLVEAIKTKSISSFAKTTGVLVVAAILAAGTFFGQFWAITEYTRYSIRGKSELTTPGNSTAENNGLSKAYAFDYSNGILEPFTLLIPNFHGGSTMASVLQDPESETYRALMNSNNKEVANQLVRFTTPYWGPQSNTAPYYAGAVIVFLFAIGIAFVESRYVWWLASIAALGIVLSWGKSFESFNYFLFDYLPGYNKFRSVTFTLIMTLFALPLLGFMGLEKLWSESGDKVTKRRLIIAFASTGGLCLLLAIFSGVFSFLRDVEYELPAWFTNALANDRQSLFVSDAFRSFAFIAATFVLLYFNVHKKISPAGFIVFLTFMITVDLAVVDRRYLSKENYQRKRDNTFFAMTGADQAILQDKDYYRVYNLQGAFNEARTSYYHNSVGGYHGAKLRRYQDFYDSCLSRQTSEMIQHLQTGGNSLEQFHGINMLNIRYITYGNEANTVLPNRSANGPAWFVREVKQVQSANEELSTTCSVNTKTTAVIDVSKFTVPDFSYDSTGTVQVKSTGPDRMVYETNTSVNSLAVFSEIYYPDGWIATIDGQEADIVRANYILRALSIPAGKHTVEFTFRPKAWTVGNKVSMASSWMVFLILFGSIAVSLRKPKD